MKKLRLVLIATCIAALCLAFTGCGGNGSNSNYAKNFIGSWELVGMEDPSGVIAEDDLELMKSLGITVSLDLNEDGSVAFDLFGETMTGTWEATSASEAALKVDGDDIAATLNNNQLTLTQQNETLIFEQAQ